MTHERRAAAAGPGFFLGPLALACFRHPLRVLIGSVLVAALSVLGARSLTLNADLAALLPPRFPSVQALEQLKERAGATGYIVVVAKGAPLPAARRFADALEPELEALDSIVYVDVRRSREWMQENALQLAPTEKLEGWAEQLEERVDREIQRRSPLHFDLEEEDDEPQHLDLDELGAEAQLDWVRHQTEGDYYEDEASGTLAVFARPAARIADLDVAIGALDQVRAVIDRVDPKRFDPGMRVALTGRYQKQYDHKLQIQRDLGTSSLLALAMVLLYLAYYFRRLSALQQLGIPLVLGLLATFGIVGATYGQLNILTAFIGAILLGLGIDHGIHLLTGYRQHQARGFDREAALLRAFSHTGRAVTIAVLTTLAGFLGLSLSEFRTFREFGVVAALGMALVLVTYSTVLPALLRLTDRGRRDQHTRGFWLQGVSRRPRPWLVVASLFVVACVLPVGRMGFDYDFNALQDSELPSYRLDKEVNRLLGYSQSPTLILTSGVAEEERISRGLREVSTQRGSSTTIDMVASLSDFVPADAGRKLEAIRRMGRAARRLRSEWFETAEARRAHQRLLTMTEQPPITLESLPQKLKRQFGLKPGRSPRERLGVVMVFPNISLARGDRVMEFASEVRSVAGSAPVAGESMVLADILETVKAESRWVLALTALGVFLALWLLQRRLASAGVAMASAGLSLAAALGLSAALGVKLNYLNMVVIPVLFGVAVDGAVHLLSERRAGVDLTQALRAIWASLLTTSLGFGALLLADHPGLRSMGTLALLGLLCNAVVSLVLLPAWFAQKRPEDSAAQASISQTSYPTQ